MSIDERIEALRVNIESLHSNGHELFEASQRHDEAIGKLLVATRQDGENIRGLARIAEIRRAALEGGDDK